MESVVEYSLFVLEDGELGSALSKLESIRKAVVAKLDELAPDYIWQRESFMLETKSTNGASYFARVRSHSIQGP